MLQLPNIDDETEAFFSHLRGLGNGEEDEDLALVDDFAMGIKFHTPSLYSFSDSDSIYNPVINNLVQLLLRVIPSSSQPYVDLLDRLLAPLGFEEICVYISKETILECLKDPKTQAFTLGILKRRLSKDEAVLRFISGTDLIYGLAEDFIVKDDTEFAVSSYICDLIQETTHANSSVLSAEKFKFLANISETELPSEMYICKHFMLLEALVSIDFSNQPWGAELFSVKFQSVLNFDNQVCSRSCLLLMASTYSKWIGRVPFSWLKEFISDLFEYVLSNHPSPTTKQDFANEFLSSYQDIFTHLLNSKGESLKFGLEVLSRPGVDIIDENEPTSYQFFSRINLNNIAGKEDMFLKHFSDLDIRSGSAFVTGCITALIKDECFFNLLVEKNMLTVENVKDWQKEFLFEFMKVMVFSDYSAQYLLAELSYLVLTYLLTVDRTMTNRDIWNSKKETIRQLLLHRNVDLGSWKSGLSRCLYEMENGRRLANLEPQVEVTSEVL